MHDTTLGPALVGMRMVPYASEDEALFDVVRLAKGMTYKSAVAETGLGGGKSVIIGDPRTMKSEALFRAMGRFIDSLDVTSVYCRRGRFLFTAIAESSRRGRTSTAGRRGL